MCRVFQETERENYARLQSKARSDKNLMIATILSHVYKSMSESLSEAMRDSPVGSLDDVDHLAGKLPLSRVT